MAARAAASSVAVLHFSARDTADTFLAEGLSEDVGTLLGGMAGVQVKPSTVVHRIQRSSGGDYARMAQLMAVRYVVDGSLRRVESHVRLNLQVIDAQRGMTVTMGKLYDAVAESLPGMAGGIAADVSAHVGGSAATASARPVARGAGAGSGSKKNSGPAYERLLRGNFLLGQRTPASIVQAYAEYREAERLDPRYATATARAAYALALAYNFEVPVPGIPVESLITRGLALADRALRTDSTLSDAWMARGYLLFFADMRTLAGAHEAFERAIVLDPRNAEAHHQYASVLNALGDEAGGSRELERALELEPARAITLYDLAMMTARDFTRSVRLLDSAIVLNPGFALAYTGRAALHVLARHPAQAMGDAQTSMRLAPTAGLGAWVTTAALALSGDTVQARAAAERGRTLVGWDGPVGCMALLALGDTVAALDVLERPSRPQMRGARLWWFLRRPEFDPIRANPRFQRVYADSRPPGARSQ